MGLYTSKARYWLTADQRRVVPEGDPDAATLYITEGREVDEAEAERLGLLKLDRAAGAKTKAARADEPTVEFEAAPELEAKVEGKAVHAAQAEDKAQAGPKASGKER